MIMHASDDRPSRAIAGAVITGLLTFTGCTVQPIDPSSDSWLAATADLVDQATRTLRVDAAGRSIDVPVAGEPDPYVVALATTALGREGLARVDEGSRRDILANLAMSLQDPEFAESSVDRLYTAAALLEVDHAVPVFSQEERAMLESVVLDAAHTAPDYYDHVDASVVMDALAGGDDLRQRAEEVIGEWAPRASAIVCSDDASPLDYWIAATVPELDIPCAQQPSRTEWLRDAHQVDNSIGAVQGLEGAVCEEARWLLRAGELWWPMDPDVAALSESIATSLDSRTSMSALVEPLQCVVNFARLSGSSWNGPMDPALLSFLASVAGRGGTSASTTLDSYSFIRFIQMIRLLDLESLPEPTLLGLSWDEAAALGVPPDGHAHNSWQAPTGGDRERIAAASHVVESALRDDDSALCATEPVEEWAMYALDRGHYPAETDLTLGAQGLILIEQCGWQGAVPAGFREALLADASRLYDYGVTGQSLASLWTAESVLCALDPTAMSAPDDLWQVLQQYVHPGGAVYFGDVLSILDTYYAVSLLSDNVRSCGDHGVMAARR